MASAESCNLEFFFIPFISRGHMIPMVDLARLFASRGVKSTIITTPYNALPFNNTINHDIDSGHPIKFNLLKFPRKAVDLPEGLESCDASASLPEMGQIFKAFFLLRPQIEDLIRQHPPNCIVSDMFYPWTADFCIELGIPRIHLYLTSFLSICAEISLEHYTPHHKVSSDKEPFIIPGLPHEIKMTRSQLPDHLKIQNEFTELMKRVSESIPKSYGILVHTFYELDSVFVEHFRKNVKDKVWHIGPICLMNKRDNNMDRGSKASINGNICSTWLDSHKPNSVLYIYFGSMTCFSDAQLYEIALSLEALGHPFIWVVNRASSSSSSWLPEGFKKRVVEEKKGLIIEGWAPQVVILDHPSIGGFMTHTGWNSILEAVAAGVPLITWPLYADQFYIEKLINEIVKTGVAVGVEGPNSIHIEEQMLVKRDKIQNAVAKVMNDGDEVEYIRKRARELGVAAKRAVEEGGSSYTSLTDLI